MAPARQRFGLLGGGVATGLPSGYLQSEFLEFTGTQTLRVDTPVDNEFGLYFDVVATNETAANNFALSMQTNEGGYKNIRIGSAATAQLTWWNGGYVIVPGGASVFNTRVLWQANFKNSRLLATDSEYGHAETTMKDIGVVSDCLPVGKAVYVEGGVFKNWLNCPSYIKAYSIKLSRGSAVTNDLIPAVDASGTPCMFDKVSKQPFYNNGSGAFVVGMTMEQARKLGKLPKTGATLTVSLPWEAQLIQHNAEVEAALETARSKGWLMKVQYREAQADSEVYNKYAKCLTVDDIKAVNADYTSDLTTSGEWVYPLENAKNLRRAFQNNRTVKKAAIFAPNCTNAERILNDAHELVEATVSLPNAGAAGSADGYWFCGAKKAEKIVIEEWGNITSLELFCYTCYQLREFYAPPMPNLRNALHAFDGCILNKESALRIFASIPAGTGGDYRLGIGIHIDHQNDEEVLAAIENAEARGWTVTVQWNGKATAQAASTFGLRRPVIYAKLGTHERHDGTSEAMLDWGHYVTNWEENGYQEFASVDEAEEYFNIEETEL